MPKCWKFTPKGIWVARMPRTEVAPPWDVTNRGLVANLVGGHFTLQTHQRASSSRTSAVPLREVATAEGARST